MKVDQEYFTMSATGVMRIKRGVQVGLPLGLASSAVRLSAVHNKATRSLPGLAHPKPEHKSNPKPQAEFTSLAEWVREKTMFDLISSIGFFRNYLTGRAFRRWHKVSVHTPTGGGRGRGRH